MGTPRDDLCRSRYTGHADQDVARGEGKTKPRR